MCHLLFGEIISKPQFDKREERSKLLFGAVQTLHRYFHIASLLQHYISSNYHCRSWQKFSAAINSGIGFWTDILLLSEEGWQNKKWDPHQCLPSSGMGKVLHMPERNWGVKLDPFFQIPLQFYSLLSRGSQCRGSPIFGALHELFPISFTALVNSVSLRRSAKGSQQWHLALGFADVKSAWLHTLRFKTGIMKLAGAVLCGFLLADLFVF